MTACEAAAHDQLDWSRTGTDVLGEAYGSEIVRTVDGVLKGLS